MTKPTDNPFRVSAFMHGLAKLIFRLTGWSIEGGPPSPLRCVIIAAPHTSNWDAFILVTAAYVFRVKLSWFVKDAAFVWPLGPIVRYFGGIPIDRSARRNMVQQAVDQFAARENFLLAVPPEGTRKHSTHWKSGFYHIARGAGVPIVLGYVDYKRKVAGLGPAIKPCGDIETDFKIFAAFYEKVTPKYPADKGIVAPRPEEPEAQARAS